MRCIGKEITKKKAVHQSLSHRPIKCDILANDVIISSKSELERAQTNGEGDEEYRLLDVTGGSAAEKSPLYPMSSVDTFSFTFTTTGVGRREESNEADFVIAADLVESSTFVVFV